MNRLSPIVGLLLLACGPTPDSSPPDPTPELESLLAASAAAWNRGDLEAFLSDYDRDPTTGFVAGGKVNHGFAWIHDNYAPSFVAGAQRDSLRFENLDARALGEEHALATARYVLYRADSVTSSGLFTLVFRLEGDRWKIVHDHTSRDR